MKKTNGRMIVKVQLSEYLHNKEVLVYSEDRRIFYQTDATQEFIDLLDEDRKAYFYAHLDKKGVIQLDEYAPEQDW